MLRVGVSSCLAGQAVRYDGAHRREPLVVDALAAAFELVPLCPEVAVGLGVPRPPVELVQTPGAPRVLGVGDRHLEVGAALEDYARTQAAALGALCGYVFKARSPSCGLDGVPLHDMAGRDTGRRGRGAYARVLLGALPWLPAIEEVQLREPVRCEQFVERVLILGRWRRELSAPRGPALAAFHASLRLSLLARGPYHLRPLGRAARGGAAGTYLAGLMRVLARPVSPRGHRRALRRALAMLPRAARTPVRALVRGYAHGELPLAAPVAALRQAAPPGTALAAQQYLAAYPAPLRLREALWAAIDS